MINTNNLSNIGNSFLTEIYEPLLKSIRKADTKISSEPDLEGYQPDLEGWEEDISHDRPGYFAAISEKEKGVLRFKTLLEESWDKDFLVSNPIPVSLEKEFENQGCLDIDLDKDCGFKDYLDPNEGNPQNITPHLLAAQKRPGIVVFTGTERLFFGLLFSNEKTCQGMVGRDINPKVKAYVDFNTALLRISKTVQEYAKLSGRLFSMENKNSLNERIDVIKSKIEASDLDTKIKKYYLENIHRFGAIYFRPANEWRDRNSEYFKYCRYDRDEQLFLRLKRYADSGNIVCIVGDINDVAFLKNRKITVIDTSNIKDYCCLDFKGQRGFQPRIIWTSQNLIEADYYSCIFKPMSERERIEFDELLNKVKATGVKIENMHRFLSGSLGFLSKHNLDPLNSHTCVLYSVETLNLLREYINNNFLKVPRFGFIDMGCSGDREEKLNTLSTEEIDELCQYPETKCFLERLMNCWVLLKPRVYLAFSKIEGWQEQFEISFANPRKNLPGFLDRLKEHHLLEEFISEFGKKRLDRLVSSIAT